MLYKISVFFLLPMAVLALFLSLFGVHQIEFGHDYYVFMSNVSRSFDQWKFEIPVIPEIGYLVESSIDTGGVILSVLIKIANFLVFCVNGLIVILNLGITVVNVLITVVQFVLTIVYQCKDFIFKVSPNVV